MRQKRKVMIFLYIVIFFISHSSYSANLGFIPTDHPFEYKFNIPNNTYHKYCKSIYSQAGEDGIILQLLKELEIKNGSFCEFGAYNGITLSNTYNLIKNYNFSGIAIELNKSPYEECAKNYHSFPNVRVFHGAVLYNDEHNNLNAWLKRGNLPYDFDILSIDIDGDDYYVWDNLTEFYPKIVIIETNPYRDPVYEELPGKPSYEYNIDLLREWHPSSIGIGCSFISTVKLGLKKGYIPLAFTGNLIFLRKDLAHHLKEFPYKISDDPYDYLTLYTHLVLSNNQWTTNTGLILNVAIRDYYLQFKRNYIDIVWLKIRMHQIINNENVIF